MGKSIRKKRVKSEYNLYIPDRQIEALQMEYLDQL